MGRAVSGAERKRRGEGALRSQQQVMCLQAPKRRQRRREVLVEGGVAAVGAEAKRGGAGMRERCKQ
jgi:hypothetical protein